MSNDTTHTDPDIELVTLAVLSLELDVPVDTIARQVRPDVVLDDLGFRCVTIDVARRLIDNRDAAAEQARAEGLRRVEQRRTQREANQRRRDAEHVARIRQRRALGDLDEMLPAAAMVAAGGEPDFDGALGIPRQSRLDWVFNKGGDEGAIISPRRRQRGAK